MHIKCTPQPSPHDVFPPHTICDHVVVLPGPTRLQPLGAPTPESPNQPGDAVESQLRAVELVHYTCHLGIQAPLALSTQPWPTPSCPTDTRSTPGAVCSRAVRKSEILGCLCVVLLGSKVDRILRKRAKTKKMKRRGKQGPDVTPHWTGYHWLNYRLVWSSELSCCMSLGAPYPEFFSPAVPRRIFARIIV
jgi:hypothetical protein